MQFSPKETSNTFFSVFWGQEENMLMLKVLLLQGYCVKYCLYHNKSENAKGLPVFKNHVLSFVRTYNGGGDINL